MRSTLLETPVPSICLRRPPSLSPLIALYEKSMATRLIMIVTVVTKSRRVMSAGTGLLMKLS